MKPDIELTDTDHYGSSSGSLQLTTPTTVSNHDQDEVLTALARFDANIERDETRVTDRGARAWLAVVAGFINFFAGFGLLNSWGTFQAKYPEEPWAKQSSSSIAEISWIGSVQPGLLFILGGLAGYASDKISAALLSRAGIILFVTSYLLVGSFGTSFVDYLALQGFLFGLANTLLYYPVTSVISDWFHKRRGLALGICASGSSLGGIFWPIVVDELSKRYSMKRALQGVALIPLIPLLIASCLARERNAQGKITLRKLWKTRCRGHRNTEKHEAYSVRTVKEPRFITLSIACFLIYGGMLIPFNYIPMFAEEHGYHDMAQYLLAICYAGSFVGRIGTGALADYLGTFNMLCATAFLTGILTLCWITMTSLLSMIAFAVLYGLFSGGLIPLGSACVAKITTPEQMTCIGFRIGFMMMICSVSAFGGGPLSGCLLESQGKAGWMAAFFLSGVTTIVGGVIVLVILVVRAVHGQERGLLF